MANKISTRLAEIVKALPLYDGIRVLEIGCGPGAAAREIAGLVGGGCIVAIDRSEEVIRQAVKNSQKEILSGKLKFYHTSVEDFRLGKEEELFDLAFAVRVGALDGRHPEAGKVALQSIAKALKENGRLFIDGGNPLKEIFLDRL